MIASTSPSKAIAHGARGDSTTRDHRGILKFPSVISFLNHYVVPPTEKDQRIVVEFGPAARGKMTLDFCGFRYCRVQVSLSCAEYQLISPLVIVANVGQ